LLWALGPHQNPFPVVFPQFTDLEIRDLTQGCLRARVGLGDAFVREAKAALIALYGKDPKSNPDYSRIINR